MKIVINKTKHGIYVNGMMLVPGTNPIDSFDDATAQVKAFVDSGDIEVKDSSKMTEKEQQEAVNGANTRASLEKLEKTFKKVDTVKQRRKLDEFDDAVRQASGEEEG